MRGLFGKKKRVKKETKKVLVLRVKNAEIPAIKGAYKKQKRTAQKEKMKYSFSFFYENEKNKKDIINESSAISRAEKKWQAAP